MFRRPLWLIPLGASVGVVVGFTLVLVRQGGTTRAADRLSYQAGRSRLVPAPVGRIAFVAAKGTVVQIVLADGSGEHLRLLNTTQIIQKYQPAWSRDGKRIAYVGLLHGDPSTAEILVTLASGGSFRQLTHNFWEDDFPTWSPDGRHIAFYSFRPTGTGIYVMNADGSHQRVLALTTAPVSWAPSWAPDGKSIAFVRGLAKNAELYTIEPNGHGLRRLTLNKAFDSDPSWSPDGSQIAFSSERGGHSQIYVMNADGTHQRRLTHGSQDDLHPSWSPDGRWIAFTRSGPSGLSRVYLISRDGFDEHPLRGSASKVAADPAWSPTQQ